MPTTIVNNGITTITQEPPAANLCAPNATPTKDLLQQNCFDAYYETCCPMVAAGLPVRITDNQRTYPASNGIANEAQNYRQISGFAETVSAGNFYNYCSTIIQGKDWGRRYQQSQTQLYCGLFAGGGTEVSFSFITENQTTTLIEEGYVFAPGTINTPDTRHYRQGNNILDPSVDRYALFLGNNTYGYAVRFANDTTDNDSQSSFNLSTNDLMSVYDWSRGNYSGINRSKQPLTSLSKPRTLPAYTPNEPTSFFVADQMLDNGDVFLAHTSTSYAALRGSFPEE